MGRKLTFLWDQANTAHIARHDVSPGEVEDAFRHPMLEVITERGGEQRVTAFAKTAAGRHLFVSYVMRGGEVRTVTAYTLPRKKRKEYDEATEKL